MTIDQAIEELKGEDYKIIQLVLKKKSDSEIADILGYNSKYVRQLESEPRASLILSHPALTRK